MEVTRSDGALQLPFYFNAIVSFDCFGSFSTPSPIYVAGTFVFPIGCILDGFLMVILSPTF